MKTEQASSDDRPLPVKTTGFTQVSAKYADAFPLRAAIQGIPFVGGSVDTLMAGLGAKWQYRRLEDFLQKLHDRLGRLEKLDDLKVIEPSEPLYDFVMRVFDQVIRSRSEAKRVRFAAIVANQIQDPREWDEAEAAARLLGELSDFHIDVLAKTIAVPPTGGVFGDLRVVRLPGRVRSGETITNTPDLQELTNLPLSSLRLVCSELVARGLLHDEGIGRMDVGGMEYFIATQLAKDFLRWIGAVEP